MSEQTLTVSLPDDATLDRVLGMLEATVIELGGTMTLTEPGDGAAPRCELCQQPMSIDPMLGEYVCSHADD